MIKKILSVCTFALTMLLFQSAALACHHCGCAEASNTMHQVIKTLDLTKEQKEKIHKINSTADDALTMKHSELKDVRMLINSAFKDGSMTENKIDEFANKQQQIVGAIMKIRMMERFELSKVLTSEQKEKLHKMLDEHMKDHAQNGTHDHSCKHHQCNHGDKCSHDKHKK